VNYGSTPAAVVVPAVNAFVTNTVPVTGTFFQGTQPVSGTVTANQGTANSLANAWPTELTDGTNGPAAVKAASTAAVVADKALVVAVSPNNSVAVTGTFFQGTQPVSGTVTANQGTANTAANSWQVEVTDGTNVLGVSAHPLRVDPTGTTTQPVSGTVTVGNASLAVTQSTSPWVDNITQVASTALGVPQTFGTAPTGVVIGTSSDMYIAGTRARSNQTTTAAGVQDVNLVGTLGVTNSVTNGSFMAITDNTTKAGVIAATTALKTDLSSVAGTATSTAASGVQKVGITGNANATLDSTIGAATAPTNALATSAVYQTTVPALTAGQAVAVQADSTGSTFVNIEGRRATYASGNSGLTSVAGVGAFLQGSSTKTVRIVKVGLNYIATSTTLAYHTIKLNRYSALSGGTNVADTITKLDTNNGTATAVCDHVTAVNTTQTLVGTAVLDQGLALSTTVVATCPVYSKEWTFGGLPAQAFVLRGTTDFLGVLFDAATLTYGYWIEWTEE
jgi:hypothetical protein